MIDIDERRAVEVTICSNAETVCDGFELGPFEDEACRAACLVAHKMLFKELGDTGESDSCFANWNGGKHCRADLKDRFTAANLFVRADEREDGDDEPVWSEWRRAGPTHTGWSPEQVAEIEMVLAKVFDAMFAELQAEATAVAQEE